MVTGYGLQDAGIRLQFTGCRLQVPVPERKGNSEPAKADAEDGAQSAEGRIYFSPGHRPGESGPGDLRPPARVG